MFVTVGNATQGFKRLLEAVDAGAGDGFFGNEPVLMQTGYTSDFRASHCEQHAFLPMPQFETLLRNSSLVISHGGAGTLIHILRAGRVPVVMPRRQRFAEHVDDHQVELVEALEKEGRVIAVLEASDLRAAVDQAKRKNERPTVSSNSQLINLVALAINELAPQCEIRNPKSEVRNS